MLGKLGRFCLKCIALVTGKFNAGVLLFPGTGNSATPSDKDAREEQLLTAKYHHLLDDYNIRGKLLEVSNRILASGYGTSTLEEVFSSVIKICMDAIGGDTSVIELYDAQQDVLVGVATDYGPYKPEGYFNLPLTEQALSTLAFHQGQTVAIDDVVNDSRVSQRIRQIFDAKSGIAAPLMVDAKVIGVILTMSKHRQMTFSNRDKQLMEGLARVAALAVHTQRLQKQRIQSEYRFQRLVANAPAAIFLLDPQLNILEANQTAENLLHIHSDRLTSMSFHNLTTDGNDLQTWQQRLAASHDGSDLYFETLLQGGNQQHQLPVEMNITTLTIAGKSVYQVFIRDITSRKVAEQELHEEKERAEVTLNSIGDAVITTGKDGLCTGLNPVAEKLLGCKARDAIGKPASSIVLIIDESSRLPISDLISHSLQGEKYTSTGDLILLAADGAEIPVEISAAPILTQRGDIAGVVVIMRDVSPNRKIAKEMSYLATHDTLTGLVNRGEFERRVQLAIASAREKNLNHVLCYIDLDRFKIVNDTCGHIAGDELLRQLTALLQEKFRTSDTLARLGGDEFGLLLENCPPRKGQMVAEDVRVTVQNFRFTWENKAFEIGASIGVTSITSTTDNLSKLLSTVDAACYAAKDEGRNRIQVFETKSENQVKDRRHTNWLQEIQDALQDSRFELWRQQIKASDGSDTCRRYEVLLRLRDRAGNLIKPGVFIPTAERFHFMTELDKWVISNTLQRIAAEDASGVHNHYSINLSGQSLSDKGILKFIIDTMAEFSIDEQRICFEITETAAISDLTHATNLMKTLQGVGFRFALDDFGSGLSSFTYLKYLSVDYLKIDGNFVKEIDQNKVDFSTVEAINSIGHAMGIKTIAEFAQSEEIIRHLQRIGVDYIQGYAVAEPELFPLLDTPADPSRDRS